MYMLLCNSRPRMMKHILVSGRGLQAIKTTATRLIVKLKMSLCNCCRHFLEVAVRYITRGRSSNGPVTVRLKEQWRTVSFLPSLADRLTSSPQRRKDYREEKILGYTQEQVYSVVSDVNNYQSFLPWCQESAYLNDSRSRARLAIGFSPLIETYTASVITDEPHSLKTMSTDGRLFTRLENSWYFRRGPDLESGPTCLLNFWVSFEFSNQLYAQLGFLVFDEVARTMAGAFEARCGELYGADHLKRQGVKSIDGLRKLLEKSKSNQLRKQGKLMETDL